MSRQTAGWGCALVGIVGLWSVSQLSAQEEVLLKKSSPVVTEWREQLGNEQKIEAVLRQPLKTPLHFEGTQFDVALHQIAKEYGIPILIDTASFDIVGIEPQAKISIRVENCSLKSAIKLLIRQPGFEELDFMVHDEAVVVSTVEWVGEQLVTRIYDVKGLDGSFKMRYLPWGGTSYSGDFNILIDVITECIQPRSWKESNGAGTLRLFNPGMLIVRQTAQVHDEIEIMLAELRKTKQEILDRTGMTVAKGQAITRGFRVNIDLEKLPQPARERFFAAIKKSVDWLPTDSKLTEEEKWFTFLPDRILVRHHPRVLEQIEVALSEMEILNRYPSRAGRGYSTGAGGGGGF